MKGTAKELAILAAGCILYVLSTILINPVDIVPGSVLGVSVVANSILGVSIGTVHLICNIPVSYTHLDVYKRQVFVQGESEIASMSMLWGAAACGERVMTSSSGPGYDLKQEGISYLASYNLPAVLADVMRYGVGDGEITEGQDSYWEAVRGGGHGDSRQIVLTPAAVQECADLT